jgi:hypothetical protein
LSESWERSTLLVESAATNRTTMEANADHKDHLFDQIKCRQWVERREEEAA